MPFLRRHRSLVRSAVVVVAVAALIAGGCVALLLGRSAPDDGVVAVTVWDATPEAGDGLDLGPGSTRFAYQLIPDRSGESVRLLGLDGPGVAASFVTAHLPGASASGSSSPSPTASPTPAGDVMTVVTVAPRCEDLALMSAEESDYHLRVERTDTLGRSVTGLVDVPAGSSQLWSTALGRSCTNTWFRRSITLEAVDVAPVAPPSQGPAVRLALHLRNGLPRDVEVGYGFYWGLPPADAPNSVTLVAGATTVLPLSLPVSDCRTATPTDLGLAGGLGLWGIVPSSHSSRNPMVTVIGEMRESWSEAVQGRIGSQLRSICAGMPSFTMAVISAAPASNAALSDPVQAQNGGSITVLRTRLRVASTAATRVTVTDTSAASPADIAVGTPVTISTASAPFRRGTADVVVDWAMTACASDVSPPSVRVLLTAHGRTYPAWAQLSSAPLAHAVTRACPGVTVANLRSAGWEILD